MQEFKTILWKLKKVTTNREAQYFRTCSSLQNNSTLYDALFYQYYHDIIVKYLTPTGYELCAINILRHFGGKVKY